MKKKLTVLAGIFVALMLLTACGSHPESAPAPTATADVFLQAAHTAAHFARGPGNRTAEISAEEKNRISHRGKALRQLVEKLEAME